ncbi:putative polyketide synthase [Coniochaeta sp. 2T2.1]|nr:putative polyketide synthase [Coniochaeta sp. 2T2.1]
MPIPIAIVGMGCRYSAGVRSPEDSWNVVAEGRSGWTEVPPDRFNHKAFYHPDPEVPGAFKQKGGHFIDQDIAAFDAGFFGMAQHEAETLDPQQRVVLETSWEAIENAGITMQQFRGSDSGVFVAMFGHDFEQMIHKDQAAISKYQNLGVARPLLANRVSYIFDLQGPSVMVDTACSGSLAAISLACQSLRSGETAMALAGGVGLVFSPDQMALMSMTGLFNDEGRSFTFDNRGNGYGRGEGVGMIALKRLDDALRDRDSIRAIIRSAGINSDGRTNGIMLPNQSAQERLARSLFRNMNFGPADLHYVEVHGTGTKAGDDVEIKTVRNVFCHDRHDDNPVYVSATKPNIGHSEAASGVAGVIKTVMAMEKGLIPPNILLENYKPGLEIGESIKVARSLTPWPSTASSRKAVVNSFGFGGTNAMILLESHPTRVDAHPQTNGLHNCNSIHQKDENIPRLFAISARSETSLHDAVRGLQNYLQSRDRVNLDDLSYTLTAKRSSFPWRSTIVANDASSLFQGLGSKDLSLKKAPNQTANVFVFTGQGAQSARMGYNLLSAKDNEFSRSISRSEQILAELGAQWSLTEELNRDEASSRLHDSKFGQPASTAIQVALVDLLRSWNVRPTAVVGHSSGEIAAAYAVGVISHSAAMRISYHRSFLAELSAQRSEQPGAMMAVGLGEHDAQKYISKIDSGAIAVACINSPSSTTISGDASGIAALKSSLDADGVFARQLKVDTAYHSHHMKLVSSDYLDQLKGLETSYANASVRYFSTVTGEEKADGFGPLYWVENLVSPVRFSAALQSMYRDLGQTNLNMIEIGPHKALSGPIRQTMTNVHAGDSQHTYIPTLVREENSVESIMIMGSNLFKSGSKIDIGAVASLAFPDSSPPAMLRDLPPYHWDHTTTYWVESRLSREHRGRKHAAHDLLGTRVVASPDSQPSWRILLSTVTLPWLRDHVVDNFIVFPAAGYMTMAIQALQQLSQDSNPNLKLKGYSLRNVSFKKTLTVPKDSKPVETMMTFHYSESTESWNFSVSSMSERGRWQDHSSGVENDRKLRTERLESALLNCTTIVSHDDIYAGMAANGNQYGPTFAIIEEARLSSLRSLNSLVVPDIAAIMPGKFLQPHIIHPTTLDAIIQACLPVLKQHSVPGSVMPVFIGDVFISANMPNQPDTKIQTVCDLSHVFARSTSFDIAVFQTDENGEPSCVLTMSKGDIRVVGESPTSMHTTPSTNNIFQMRWSLDISSVTAEKLESAVVPLQSDQAGFSQAEKVNLCSIACARYIDWAVRQMHERGLTVKDDHRSRARLFLRIGPELVPLLTGQTDPITHFLRDDLLFRVYHSDEGARPNRYMADYVKILTFQRWDLRILEIGAGTGGTTQQILQACSPNGEDFCAEYMYTDISSGFFEPVRTGRLKSWAQLLTFQTLDLEKEAAEQGFQENYYDLVIAANVVHATRSLSKSLGTIHKLLRPGGTLGLVERTRTTPYINMTFGSIPGWWAGFDDGRTDSPLQSAEQWDGHLRKANFSGVDLAAYDLPEPERHCALLLSAALAIKPASNGSLDSSRSFRILNFIPEGLLAQSFVTTLATELIKGRSEVSMAEWTDVTVEVSSTYIILESAQRPFLTQASGAELTRVMSVLSKASRMYWISLADGSGVVVPENALAQGLCRTARNERPDIDLFTIDVQDPVDQYPDKILDTITRWIRSTETKIARNEHLEFELMYRHGDMLIRRLAPSDRLVKGVATCSGSEETVDTSFHQAERPLRIKVDKPGLLSSLVFVDDNLTDLGPDEVEIQSFAWGINFSDVFIALGQLPPTQPMVGESAGLVTAVGTNFATRYKRGDRVTAMFGTPYASRARSNGHLVHRIPDSMSFTQAAGIPLTLATAYYALFDCATIQQGQTVLIHSASGALGQAAIKICQRVGATIIATASSTAKRQLLTEQYGIPQSHLFSSRSTDFAAGVKRLTGGTGVDVVLNSLSGPMLHASWECVAPFGIFVEVGKADIARRSQLSMQPFEKNLRFASVDLVLLSRRRPAHCQKLLASIFADLEAGLLTPLPVTAMPIGDIEKAFRLMQSRSHSGKIVLEATDESTVQARVPPVRILADGTYVIVGGLGGVGKHLCRHLQKKGARHIALFTRRDFDATMRAETEKELSDAPDVVVRVVTCDVGDAEVVARVAAELKRTLPPVKGVLHGGMVLSDRLISQITRQDFVTALRPKYFGTINLFNAFYNDDIDFFINLSSLCGVVGTLGQSNYAAGGTYQDMFAHAQLWDDRNKVLTLDLPLIKSTYTVTQEHTQFLARQGIQLLPMEAALPVVDYAISGRAFKDGCHQIAFGLDPEPFVDRSKDGASVTPLVSQVVSARGRGTAVQNEPSKAELPVEKKIASATTMEEAEQLILAAIREKIALLTAIDLEELALDPPVVNLGLDSLVATEIQNWITHTLKAPVQTSDILDAPSSRSLASSISKISGLVEAKSDSPLDEQANGDTGTNGHTTLSIFLDSVSHIGSASELEKTRAAVETLRRPGGLGQRLQARLEELSGNQGENNEVVDMYVRNKWLRGRDWRPRLRNFFATLPRQDSLRCRQAEQAARLSLAAYGYKLALDGGFVRQDVYNGEALDMATVTWLFGTNRTPALGCDRMDRFPESDHVVVMKRGHAYKVPLQEPGGQVLSAEKLELIFETISGLIPEETNPACVLTTANRDEWAETREQVKATNQANHDFVTTTDSCLFIVCLEDAQPETEKERADVFLLDDNSNRWLDKTLSLVVCANGVSAIWGEHTMVDGTTFGGLIKALDQDQPSTAVTTNGNPAPSVDVEPGRDFTYLSFTLPPALSPTLPRQREQHISAHAGYTLANLYHTAYGTAYLRQHKLSPKSVMQLVIQVAARHYFGGYNPPGAVDVVSERSFRGGRTDMIYVMTPPVQAFCAATAENGTVQTGPRKRALFLDAVRSHARLLALATRGRAGFRWHLMALREMLRPGEEAPELYRDAVYQRTSERPVCTSFTEFGLPEMGRCQPNKGDVWVGVQVLEER